MNLTLTNTSRDRRLDHGDKICMWLLALVYTVFTLLNLGTLNFPQKAWTGTAGEQVTFDFGTTQYISSVWVNGNIANGTVRFSDENGNDYIYEQAYGEMFSWKEKDLGFAARYIYITVLSGEVSFNEIAFFDGSGNLITPQILSDNTSGSSAAALIDEQSTVPARASYMNGMYFDEIYHARTAYEFLHGMSVYEWTHPPLGKLIISLGILIFGMTPFGWRFMPAVFGAGMIPILFIFAKRIFKRRDYAFLAAALFALDTMHFAQTRIATVDVFIVFFELLMYLFMYDYITTDDIRKPLRKSFLPLGACGIAFGLGVASKWTGLYAGVGLAVLFFCHIIQSWMAGRKEPALRTAVIRRIIYTLLFCCGFFLAIPALIYFLSYIPFYIYDASVAYGSYGLRDMVRTLIQQQESMYAYHHNLTATHSCQSAWYEWPFTSKSVWFYYGSVNDRISSISSYGSPAVWWVSTVGFLAMCIELIAGRMKKMDRTVRTAVIMMAIGLASAYLPWISVSRCTFQYHFFPSVPFILLGALLMLMHLEESREVSPKIKWIWLGVAALYFILLYPSVSGLPITRGYAYFLEHILPTGLIFQGIV